MSSKNRAGSNTSVPLDQYNTPANVCNAVFPLIKRSREGVLFEPCCGTGNIMQAAKDAGFLGVVGYDIDQVATAKARARGLEAYTTADSLTDSWGYSSVIVTNPPFVHAEAFLRKALDSADEVAFLLRVGFLGSKKREKLFAEIGMPELHILSPRPSFVTVAKCPTCDWRQAYDHDAIMPAACPICAGGLKFSSNDSSEYAWMLWGEGHTNTVHRLEVT